MLSPEQNKIFDSYDQMFATEGWKMHVDEIKQNQQSIFPQLMSTASSLENLHFLKGRNDAYNAILGLQNLMENVKKNLEEQTLEQVDSI